MWVALSNSFLNKLRTITEVRSPFSEKNKAFRTDGQTKKLIVTWMQLKDFCYCHYRNEKQCSRDLEQFPFQAAFRYWRVRQSGIQLYYHLQSDIRDICSCRLGAILRITAAAILRNSSGSGRTEQLHESRPKKKFVIMMTQGKKGMLKCNKNTGFALII